MSFISNPELRKRGMEVFAELYSGSNAEQMHEEYGAKAQDFLDMSLEWAIGGLFGRPGLDMRAREIVALTLVVADHTNSEALIAHAHACVRTGMSKREIYEAILMTIWYIGAPGASWAFSVLKGFFDDMEST